MAGPGVDLERRADGVAVVYLRNPPVNALHPAREPPPPPSPQPPLWRGPGARVADLGRFFL